MVWRESAKCWDSANIDTVGSVMRTSSSEKRLDLSACSSLIYIPLPPHSFDKACVVGTRCIKVPLKRQGGQSRAYYNKHENSIENIAVATKDIENGLGTHGDCASLVVVSGGIPFASEYEGQVSVWPP